MQTLLDSFLDGIVDREAYTAKRAKLMSRKKPLEEQIGRLAGGACRLARTAPKVDSNREKHGENR